MSIFWMTSHAFFACIFHMSLEILYWKQLFFIFEKLWSSPTHTFHTHAATTEATTREKNLSEFQTQFMSSICRRERERETESGRSFIWCAIIISVRCDIGILWNKRVKRIDKKKILRKLSRLIFTNSGRVFLSRTRSLALNLSAKPF